jgi:hypothetical protein
VRSYAAWSASAAFESVADRVDATLDQKRIELSHDVRVLVVVVELREEVPPDLEAVDERTHVAQHTPQRKSSRRRPCDHP